MDLQGDRVELPKFVDILVVGAGPAGLLLSAQLSQFPGIITCVIEQRPGRLEKGHADGLQIRTLEIFKAIGISDEVVSEGYKVKVNEMTFWEAGEDEAGIRRVSRSNDQDQEVSDMPHLILSQSRVQDHLLKRISESVNPSLIVFNCKLETFSPHDELNRGTVSVAGKTQDILARYVVGCDGAHSATRRAAGIPMEMQPTKKIWGVMDCLVITSFPDIRRKSAIRSAAKGSILLIPKPEVEHGATRIYVEMPISDFGAEMIIKKAQEILQPYSLDVVKVVWWSRYSIAQNLCTAFDKFTTCFLAGDACHTHSPKAGQGMNVSLADAFNLGWKLAAVVSGSCDKSILATYGRERYTVAKELINFDKEMNEVFTRHSAAGEQALRDIHHRQSLFMAGLAVEYSSSSITAPEVSKQDLALGFPVGQRFRSFSVLRCCDACHVQLSDALVADGRWRLVVFAGKDEPTVQSTRTWKLLEWLRTCSKSPIKKYTAPGSDTDSTIAVLAVYRASHLSFNIFEAPEILLPKRGRLHGVRDPNQIFTDRTEHTSSIYHRAKIACEDGALVIIRPDQHVAAVVGLEDTSRLANFFDGFMRPVLSAHL